MAQDYRCLHSFAALPTIRWWALLAGALAISPLAQAQTGPAQCAVTSSPPQIRAEGVAERVGDIFLQCSFGGNPSTLSGILVIYLPVAVTNAVNANGVARDAALLADSGSGYVPTGIPAVVSGQSVSFYGINLPVPASGNLNLKVSSIRVNATQVTGAAPRPIIASISFSAAAVNQSQVTVAYPVKSLYATLYDTGITCLGSPLPDTISVTNLYAAGTALASTRLTEAIAGAFQSRGAGDDNGTRFIVNYSGAPANTQLFLPDFVSGSDALVPTSGGDLGTAQAVGQYVRGSGTLLLARVTSSDSTGTGGAPMALPAGAGSFLLDSASSVPLTGGAGYAVYEVVDGNLSSIESVQFPTFLGLSNVTAAAVVQETVSYAPVSSVAVASQTAPVPRFVASQPTSDCSIVGDCQANYFPKLQVATYGAFQTTVTAGGPLTGLSGLIYINNGGGGILDWVIATNYQNGSGWLMLNGTSGQNNATVGVWVEPQNLAAGVYTANLVVSGGGPLSNPVTIPVTLTVKAAPATPPAPPPAPPVAVTSVVNAASLLVAPLVPGSLATVWGTNMAGNQVAVTFDGTSATLLYTSATQINLQVPPSLDPSKTSASLVVTVDGVSSNAVMVALAPAGPAIFNPGVLNQDNTLNAPASPAKAASVLQIFATGIPAGALVTVQIGGLGGLAPQYAGAAPGLTGVQQVNVAVPGGLTPGAEPLTICALAQSQQFCSPGYTVYLQ
jgi:uncharacterized protein (TIGR03437 family)